ncbi:MAG: SpaA isopeptide-forming pilin-related protein, partial [Faecousia sp.]
TGSSYQTTISLYSASSSNLNAYFKLKAAPQVGNISLTKTTEDGQNLSGWQFGIYSNSACTNLVSGPHTTNASGKISVTDLSAGTYYVKELGHTDSAINALYYCSSTNPQPVTVTAGATATVSFTNKLNTGGVKLVKTTRTGKNLDGWKIGLYTDAACTSAVTGSPFTTGSDGTVSVTGLTPGTYYAKEVAVSDPYWACDSEVKTVTVTANATATATFSNTHYGDLRIQKNAVNGSAEGWSFQILDADKNVLSTVKTGADGYAYSDKLLPGQYYVREVHDRNDTYWEYDATVEKQITVTAGSQAEVSYTNTLYGRIEFKKTTNTGNQLGGWTFRVKDTSGNLVGEYTTDENGYACTEKLAPGRYLVYEVSSEDAYWNCELGFHDATVVAGETVVDTWLNREQGLAWFRKTTNTGESVEGWHITVYADDACTQEIGTLITNEDGKAGYYLDPGTYWAKETGDEHGRFEDEYWMVDETVQKFEIKPHEDVSITFTNVQYGRLKITKTVEGDGSVEGWQ